VKRFFAWTALLWLGFGLACWSTGLSWQVWAVLVVPSTLLLAWREVADRHDVRAGYHSTAPESATNAAHARALAALDRTIERIEADHA